MCESSFLVDGSFSGRKKADPVFVSAQHTLSFVVTDCHVEIKRMRRDLFIRIVESYRTNYILSLNKSP